MAKKQTVYLLKNSVVESVDGQVYIGQAGTYHEVKVQCAKSLIENGEAWEFEVKKNASSTKSKPNHATK